MDLLPSNLSTRWVSRAWTWKPWRLGSLKRVVGRRLVPWEAEMAPIFPVFLRFGFSGWYSFSGGLKWIMSSFLAWDQRHKFPYLALRRGDSREEILRSGCGGGYTGASPPWRWTTEVEAELVGAWFEARGAPAWDLVGWSPAPGRSGGVPIQWLIHAYPIKWWSSMDLMDLVGKSTHPISWWWNHQQTWWFNHENGDLRCFFCSKTLGFSQTHWVNS